MEKKIIVRVVVTSELVAAAEIEKLIGLNADRRWGKGEFRGKTTIREKNSGWMLVSEFPVNTTLEEAVSVMLRRLHPIGENLRSLGTEFQKELSAVIYYDQLPVMTLSAAVIKTLGAYSLGIDLDLYASGEEG
jgi:hypothetical protein